MMPGKNVPPPDAAHPTDVTTGPDGSLYVTDSGKNQILKIGKDGQRTILTEGADGHADGPLAQARFRNIHSLRVREDGTIFLTDAGNKCIRVISPDGVVSTLAGSGDPAQTLAFRDANGRDARFSDPLNLALGKRFLYVSDPGNNRIRTVSMEGVVSTLVGGGPRCHMASPGSLGILTPATENCFADGLLDSARIDGPAGLALIKSSLFVADAQNYRIRRIQLRDQP